MTALGTVGVLLGASATNRAWHEFSRDQRLLDLQAEQASGGGNGLGRVQVPREMLIESLAGYRDQLLTAVGILSAGVLLAAGGGFWWRRAVRRAEREGTDPVQGGRAPAVGATADLVALPLAMAALSLLVWGTQPRGIDLIRANATAISLRRQQVLRIVAAADPDSVQSSRCLATVLPPPHYAGSNTDARTNTLILGPDQLADLGGTSAWQDALGLEPPSPFWSLPSLVDWQAQGLGPPYRADKKTKALVQAALATRYLVLYRAASIQPAPGEAVAAPAVVQAALFEIGSGRRLCELAFRTAESGSAALEQLMKELAVLTGGSLTR